MPRPNILVKQSLSRACVWLLLLCFALGASAQLHIPLLKKDKDKTYNPDTVADTLRNADDRQRNELASEIGILAPNPSNPSAVSDAPCTTFSQVEEKKLRLKAAADNALIIAYSSQCDSTYLIAFERGEKSEWRHLHTLRLTSRVQRPEISFAEMVQPGVSEILIHRETTRDSGGSEQENFIILKLLHDRLVPVLDTVERLDLVLPTRTVDDGDTLEQSQKSSFKMIKGDPKAGTPTRILERQVLKQKKISIALYRSWVWDPDLESFRWAPSDDSERAQWQEPAKAAPKSAATAAPAKPAGNAAAPTK